MFLDGQRNHGNKRFAANPEAVGLLALSNLKHFGRDAPDYSVLFDALDGCCVRRVGSVDPAATRDAHEGEVLIADAHRDHLIDIFTVRAAAESELFPGV